MRSAAKGWDRPLLAQVGALRLVHAEGKGVDGCAHVLRRRFRLPLLLVFVPPSSPLGAPLQVSAAATLGVAQHAGPSPSGREGF